MWNSEYDTGKVQLTMSHSMYSIHKWCETLSMTQVRYNWRCPTACILFTSDVKLWSPFLTGRTISSPNMVRTVRRTILRFLTDLLMRCKLQPKLRCGGCTQIRVNLHSHDTCSLLSIWGQKPRQSSPLPCHTLPYLLAFIHWVPQITLILQQVHK